jgi:hypothetical protein
MIQSGKVYVVVNELLSFFALNGTDDVRLHKESCPGKA